MMSSLMCWNDFQTRIRKKALELGVEDRLPPRDDAVVYGAVPMGEEWTFYAMKRYVLDESPVFVSRG
jgi:hypothetical protein